MDKKDPYNFKKTMEGIERRDKTVLSERQAYKDNGKAKKEQKKEHP